MTQKTLLNDTHRALGAKMVDFGGWDMPIHYGSQLDEHHLVRRESGVFDVSHMTVVDLRGDQVKPFLRRLLANSVDKLKVTGKALYSCMLNPRGGVIDDLIVYYLGVPTAPSAPRWSISGVGTCPSTTARSWTSTIWCVARPACSTSAT